MLCLVSAILARKIELELFFDLQANEETGNRRPVMISVQEKESSTQDKSTSATAPPPQTGTIFPEPPKATSTPMEESPPDSDGAQAPQNIIANTVSAAVSSQQQQQSQEGSGQEVKTSIPMLDGLTASERTALLKACVGLVDVPVEPDALNAVLRLCLRLTQVRMSNTLVIFHCISI